MITNSCKAARQEIDEAGLDQPLSVQTNQHLKACNECRGFNNDRRVLRNLMNGLATVSAPADFDFRLRARLAREKEAAPRGFDFLSFSFGMKAIAAAALLVVVAVTGIVIKQHQNSPSHDGTIVNASPQPPDKGPSRTIPSLQGSSGLASSQGEQGTKPTEPRDKRRTPRGSQLIASRTARDKNIVPAVRDYALTFAPVMTRGATLFRVPITSQPLSVSIDNGSGMTRTISLPPVSFGSERLLSRGSSIVPASAKGTW